MLNAVRQTVLATLALTSAGTATVRADALLNQEGDFWRVSKLVGLNIYGPDKRKVGDISDVLMSKDGKATYVVVGVGGFLGIGEKNVAIPFDKVTFSQEPMSLPVATGAAAPLNNMAATAGMNTGAPVRTDAGAPDATPAAGAATPAAPRSTAYPDHGSITYTADELKSAPTFTFAK